MKVLIDESLPRMLRRLLPKVMALTVQQMGWTAVRNGELLRLAEKEGFNVFITADKNLKYQQNLSGRSIAIIVLASSKRSLVNKVAERRATVLETIQPSDLIEL